MRTLNEWSSTARIARNGEFRGRALYCGRGLIAAAELSVIAFTSGSTMFGNAVDTPIEMNCTGVRAASLWCRIGQADHELLVGRMCSIVILGLVVLGYRPRWTCVPHWYVAFSIAASAPTANGGDKVAAVLTLLLIPLCLGDGRVWQWQSVRSPLSPRWRGSALAAHTTIRLQVAFVYVSTTVSKLNDPLWRQGSALYVAVHDPDFGFPAEVLALVEHGKGFFWLMALANWAVILAQLAIACCLLGGRSARWTAFGIGVGLHLVIGVFMMLPSFGGIMIGALLLCAASEHREPQRSPRTDPQER